VQIYRCSLGELKVEDVNFLEDALSFVESLATALGESAESVPLVADPLAARVDGDSVVIFQCAEKRRPGISVAKFRDLVNLTADESRTTSTQ